MKLKLTVALAATLALAYFPTSILASDHVDGEVTKNDSVTDLTDLFAFETPGTPGNLTLVLNVHPFAMEKNHFSSKAIYNLVIREASLSNFATKGIETDCGSEKRIRCSFDDEAQPHTMTFSVDGCDTSRTVNFNQIDSDPDERSGLRVFAGHRADPFFFSAPWAGVTAGKGVIAPDMLKGTDSMARMNALSIVIDVDLNTLFGKDVSLLAVVAECVDAKSGERFDRVGRPEVTNVTMVAHAPSPDLRDTHNGEAPFGIEAADLYRARVLANIGYYDDLDGTTHWTDPRQKRAYADLIADDFLLIDMSQPIAAGGVSRGYFAIESQLLAGEVPTTRGGRLLTDDIMDTLFTLLINSNQGPQMSDGVDAPSAATADAFPYLAAPDFGEVAKLTALGGRKLSGLGLGDLGHEHEPDAEAAHTHGQPGMKHTLPGAWRR